MFFTIKKRSTHDIFFPKINLPKKWAFKKQYKFLKVNESVRKVKCRNCIEVV